MSQNTPNGSRNHTTTSTSTSTTPRRSHRKPQSSRSKSKHHHHHGDVVSGAADSGMPFILQFYNKSHDGGLMQQQQQHQQHDVSSQLPEDPCHNGATPCGLLIRAATLDILPENNHVIESLPPPTATISTTTTTTTPSTTTTTNTNIVNAPTTTLTAPATLLGRIVKHTLLEQRQHHRHQQEQGEKTKPGTTMNHANSSHHEDVEAREDGTSTDKDAAAAAKRKKKKKKRKSKAAATSTTTSLSGDDGNHSDGNEEERNDDREPSNLPQPTYVNVVTTTTTTNNTTEPNGTKWTSSNDVDSVVLQSSETSNMSDKTVTEDAPPHDCLNQTLLVDSCLDAILAANSNVPAQPPSNRTLESFVTFLSQRLPQYQTSPSSFGGGNNQINKKKHGDDNDTSTTASSSTTAPTSVTKRKKTAAAGGTTDSSRSFAVSVETLFQVCDSFQCLKCRQSVQRILASLVQEHRHYRFAMEQQNLLGGGGGGGEESVATAMPCLFIDASEAKVPAEEEARPSQLTIPIMSRLLNGKNNYDDDDDDWDVERAFDYVALEEGTNMLHGSDISRVVPEEAAVSSDKLVLHLEQNEKVLVLTNAVTGIGNQQTMETFLRSVVLASGLEAHHVDHAANTFALSERQFQFIRDQVQEQQKRIASELDAIGIELATLEGRLEDICRGSSRTSNDETESNCEFKSTPELRFCERKSVEISGMLARFLRNLTREYHVLLLKTQDAKSLDDVLESLWKAFFDAVKEIMVATDEYHSQIENFAGRDSIPQMFVSAEHRRIFRQMLETKVRHLSACYKHFFSRLLQETKGGEDHSKHMVGFSFLRCMFTLDTFCSITGKLSSNDDHQAKLDELWGNTTQQLITCASVINLGYVTDIEAEHRSRREQLDEYQLNFFQTVKAQYQYITERHRLPERYIHRWQDLVNQYMNLQRQRRADVATYAFQTNLQHQGLFQGITRVMFQLWSQANAILGHVHRSNNETQPCMPVELKKWMSDTQVGRPTTLNLASDQLCSGGGGKRRLTCILAGFIYRWLAVRCEEWNSELAEVELLTSVENASPVDGIEQQTTSGKTVKTGKKSRRKRDKKSFDPASSLSFNLALEPSDDVNSVDGSVDYPVGRRANIVSNADVLLKNNPEASAVADNLQASDRENAAMHHSISVNEVVAIYGEWEDSTAEEIEVTQHNRSCDEAVESSSKRFCSIAYGYVGSLESPEAAAKVYKERSTVFIVDPSGSESAEDFLVGRLLKLLNGNESFVRL